MDRAVQLPDDRTKRPVYSHLKLDSLERLIDSAAKYNIYEKINNWP